MTQTPVATYLKKLGEFHGPLGWDSEDLDEYCIIPWTEFYRTMALSTTRPILTDQRVIKDKYNMMIALGFATQVNSKACRYDVKQVRDYLMKCAGVC